MTAADAEPTVDTVPAVDAGERWSLLDRRDFLRRSLDDADREHEAGDLVDADYQLLRRRDEAKLAEVEARLAALDALADRTAGDAATSAITRAGDRRAGRSRSSRSTAGRPAGHTGGDAARRRRFLHRPRRRAWLGVVGALVILAGVVVLVVSLTSTRLPGQVATGDVRVTGAKLIEEQLDQAAVLADQGHPVEALQLYQEVLAKDPSQSTALAEGGWLEWESGKSAGVESLVTKGQTSVAKAVRVAPSFYAGHLYMGTIDFEQGDDAAAVAQYRLFLDDHPPAKWTKDYAPQIRSAFSDDGQAVPAGVPAA